MAHSSINHLNDEQIDRLMPVLTYLSNQVIVKDGTQNLDRWQITTITGGMNNLVYKVVGSEEKFAVKFTIRDVRNRAWREYHTLLALEKAGLSLAPKAMLLDEDRYTQPVVVQSWLEGNRLDKVPQSDSVWLKLIEHFSAIHSFTQDQTDIELPEAVMNSCDIPSSFTLLQHHLTQIPATEQPQTLTEVIRQLEHTNFPYWSPVKSALCRADPNTLNIIQMPDQWRSVDWENSGWGDPAFEVADIITHPAYAGVSQTRWDWVVKHYCQRSPDPTMADRIQVYTCFMLVWWLVRITRYLYEMPRKIDARITPETIDWQVWQKKRHEQYQEYLDLAWEIGKRVWGW